MFNGTSSCNDHFLILCKCLSFNTNLPSAELLALLVFQGRLTPYLFITPGLGVMKGSALVCIILFFSIYRDNKKIIINNKRFTGHLVPLTLE